MLIAIGSTTEVQSHGLEEEEYYDWAQFQAPDQRREEQAAITYMNKQALAQS